MKCIVDETKGIAHSKEEYHSRINSETTKSDVSTTLAKLLSELSDDLSENSLPGILIGNMITSCVAKRYTSLMVALAVMVRQKEVVEHLHEYRVVCSYDELKRFRPSVAFHACSANNSSILRHHSEGLVQAVADNFDCNISSMNGLRQTHSLALMMIQHGREAVNKDEFIKRLKKADLKDIDLPDVEMSRYTGPKKPCMPGNDVHSLVPPLKVLCGAVISENVNSEFDFMFLKSIAETPDTPEYSGYNTRAARERGRSLGEALPLTTYHLPLTTNRLQTGRSIHHPYRNE